MKKRMLIGGVLVIMLGAFLYVEVGKIRIERKVEHYLTEVGIETEMVSEIKVNHSFLSVILSYDEWPIYVVFEDELDKSYWFSYENGQIQPGGISGGQASDTKEDFKYVEYFH